MKLNDGLATIGQMDLGERVTALRQNLKLGLRSQYCFGSIRLSFVGDVPSLLMYFDTCLRFLAFGPFSIQIVQVSARDNSSVFALLRIYVAKPVQRLLRHPIVIDRLSAYS